MRLSDLDPDTLLEQLEKRQDKAIDATDHLNRIEASHKALESVTYKASRSAGMSIEDAKRAIQRDDMVTDSLNNLFDAQKEQAHSRAAVERAKLAFDLYRTIRADNRNV